jgi:predicted Fe-Mo cluster-binding NifX family protein
MRIAFATDGDNLEGEIAFHFGRAKNFLIYDTEKKNFEVFENPELKGKELPPDFLYRQRINVVITLSLGEKAYQKFKNYKIKIYKAIEEKIKDNIQKFENNELKEIKKEDIF